MIKIKHLAFSIIMSLVFLFILLLITIFCSSFLNMTINPGLNYAQDYWMGGSPVGFPFEYTRTDIYCGGGPFGACREFTVFAEYQIIDAIFWLIILVIIIKTIYKVLITPIKENPLPQK